MRASEGSRRVSAWRKLTGLVSASVLVLSIIGSGTASAATPAGWSAGCGIDSSLAAGQEPCSGASSTLVSAGHTVGFFEWLRNAGPSNISQLYVVGTSSAATAGAQFTIKDSAGNVVAGPVSCPIASPLICSVGALNAGQTVYLVAAFTAPPSTADGSLSVSFDWNSTGIVVTGKNKSHGDAINQTETVQVAGSGNVDAAGDFNFAGTGLTVVDGAVGPGNAQQTSVTIAAGQFGAAVADGNQPNPPCKPSLTVGFPSWFKCSSLSSETSTLEVGNGATFDNPNGAGTPGILTTVSFVSAPNQLHGGHPFVYHYWKVGTSEYAELITAPCTFGPAFPGFPTNIGPCLTVGSNSVTFWLTHNGGARM